MPWSFTRTLFWRWPFRGTPLKCGAPLRTRGSWPLVSPGDFRWKAAADGGMDLGRTFARNGTFARSSREREISRGCSNAARSWSVEYIIACRPMALLPTDRYNVECNFASTPRRIVASFRTIKWFSARIQWIYTCDSDLDFAEETSASGQSGQQWKLRALAPEATSKETARSKLRRLLARSDTFQS